jgi:chloride channel 3/4/5
MSRIKLAMDSSQAWIILVCTGYPLFPMLTTGVSVGILAASIDIVADWLGDLKEGFCKPTFYLNRGFCCWGISEQEYCSDWHTWATAMNISSHAGGYIVSYIMFIILAVPPSYRILSY